MKKNEAYTAKKAAACIDPATDKSRTISETMQQRFYSLLSPPTGLPNCGVTGRRASIVQQPRKQRKVEKELSCSPLRRSIEPSRSTRSLPIVGFQQPRRPIDRKVFVFSCHPIVQLQLEITKINFANGVARGTLFLCTKN